VNFKILPLKLLHGLFTAGSTTSQGEVTDLLSKTLDVQACYSDILYERQLVGELN
jgi:hypothetical protein